MLPGIRSLFLVAGIAGATFLFSPDTLAITIRLAEVQNEYAVVIGRKADAYAPITWEGSVVAETNKRGNFNFEEAEVPSDCVGMLSDGKTTIDVELSDCTPDSGGPPVTALLLHKELGNAHDGDAVRAVGFGANGLGEVWPISGGEDAYLRRWDLELFEKRSQYVDHIVYDLDTSVDGARVATGVGGWNGGTDSQTLRISDTSALDFLVGTRAPIGYVYCVALSPDKQWTVASGFYGDIVVYDTYSLELYTTKATKKKRTKALAFSPDGKILASTSTAGRIQLRSFPETCLPGSCELELLPVSLSHSGSWSFPVAFSPDNTKTKIVSGTDSGMIKVWTIENLDHRSPDVSVLAVDSGAVYSLAWSQYGSMIVTGGNGDITVYDADSLEILFRNVDAHSSRVNDVAFSPDGSMIASGGDDGDLKLWIVP